MTLRRDKIKDHIEGLGNDEKKWNNFTLQQVAQAAHNAVEPEIKELHDKIAKLEKGEKADTEENAGEHEEIKQQLSDATAKAEKTEELLLDLIETINDAADFDDLAKHLKELAKEHKDLLPTVAQKAEEVGDHIEGS